MVVFHRKDRDPRPLFEDIIEEIRYVSCDEDGKLLEDVTLKKGDSFYVVGEKAYLQKVKTMICPKDMLPPCYKW